MLNDNKSSFANYDLCEEESMYLGCCKVGFGAGYTDTTEYTNFIGSYFTMCCQEGFPQKFSTTYESNGFAFGKGTQSFDGGCDLVLDFD